MAAVPRVRPRGLLFDLDGTLLDTAPDLIRALNRTRADEGLAPLPPGPLRACVARGSDGLLEAGFAAAGRAATERRRARLLAHYRAAIAHHTRLFSGMHDVLACLAAQRRPWGIVTNKPGWLTAPLLAAVDLAERADCVVSGDTLAQAKPHPAPLLHAAALLELPPAHCLYVGDSSSDVAAARAAGMPVLAARYGYRQPDDDPLTWHADGVLAGAGELHAWI